MNIFQRIGIWGKVIFAFLFSFGGSDKNIYSAQETVDKIADGKSLIRFGDGEFGIFHEKDIHYQKWSPQLKEAFIKIKEDFENLGEDCPFLLAVPQKFMQANGFQLMKKRVYVSCWAQARYDFKREYRKDCAYGDAFLFEKNNKEIYSQIWNRETCPPNVIFVHNNEEYARFFTETYQKNTVHVACPSKNAFEQLDMLEKEILNLIEKNGWTNKDVSLAISAGPAGKVLVYTFSKRGYQSIDAGHCWDEPLENI